jgi:predicted metalloprotease
MTLAGGGGIGVLVLIVFVLLGGDIGQLGLPGDVDVFDASTTSTTSDLSTCQTGEDANERLDCRVVGFANSIQDYWDGQIDGYVAAPTTIFDGAVDSGCGFASAAVGPFYCPVDGSVYLDLSFFDDLRTRLGAEGGPFAQAYVIAHEYGHHVQYLLGDLSGPRDVGAGGRSVAVELQADCYSGVWAAHGAATGFLVPPTDDEIAVALDAAAAVGDDRLQRRSGGQVDPETWTHGSSGQRQDWFLAGYRDGDPLDCQF